MPADGASGRTTHSTLQLLGGFHLLVDGQRIHLPRAEQRLLACLALAERPTARSRLAGRLWPDTAEPRAMARLRTALWRLRQPGRLLLDGSSDEVGLGETVAVDVLDLTELARRFLDASTRGERRSAGRADRCRRAPAGMGRRVGHTPPRAVPADPSARPRAARGTPGRGGPVRSGRRGQPGGRRRRPAARERSAGPHRDLPRRGQRPRGRGEVPRLPRDHARRAGSRTVTTDGGSHRRTRGRLGQGRPGLIRGDECGIGRSRGDVVTRR